MYIIMDKNDSEQFKDMMEAVRLIQKVTFDIYLMSDG